VGLRGGGKESVLSIKKPSRPLGGGGGEVGQRSAAGNREVNFQARSKTSSDYCLHHVRPSLCPSTWNSATATGRVFVKFHIWDIC